MIRKYQRPVGKVEQQRGRDDIQIVANTIVEASQFIKRFENQTEQVATTEPGTGRWYLRITAAAQAAGALETVI